MYVWTVENSGYWGSTGGSPKIERKSQVGLEPWKEAGVRVLNIGHREKRKPEVWEKKTSLGARRGLKKVKKRKKAWNTKKGTLQKVRRSGT